jgi:hypothetical protein
MGATPTVNNYVLTVSGYIFCVFLGAIAATIVVWIWQEKIDLRSLLNEANGQASMSRFQLLIFTFVIAISLFELVEKRPDGTFPDIPQGVLTLLGISASTYAVGKGISYSQPNLLGPQPTGGDGAAGPQPPAPVQQAPVPAAPAPPPAAPPGGGD